MKSARLRGLALAPLISLLLTGCANSKSESSTEKVLTIPATCENQKIIDALPADVRANAKYIPTKWQPATGTDLETVLNNGGLACSYGIQNAEIGATIYWTATDFSIFESRKEGWIALGMKEIKLANGDTAYAVGDNKSLNPEIHSWAIEISHKNVWIHIGATYVYTLKDAQPIIDAAIASLH
jgi:hypothetical protein